MQLSLPFHQPPPSTPLENVGAAHYPTKVQLPQLTAYHVVKEATCFTQEYESSAAATSAATETTPDCSRSTTPHNMLLLHYWPGR
jgi:hypothetical protein